MNDFYSLPNVEMFQNVDIKLSGMTNQGKDDEEI